MGQFDAKKRRKLPESLGLKVMNAEELKVGRTYFACAYFIRNKPTPEIETWIYLGKNISSGDSESEDSYHYFQDPESYYQREILDELTEEQAQEYENPESPIRMRVLESEVEGLVQDLKELKIFIEALSGELNADEAF